MPTTPKTTLKTIPEPISEAKKPKEPSISSEASSLSVVKKKKKPIVASSTSGTKKSDEPEASPLSVVKKKKKSVVASSTSGTSGTKKTKKKKSGSDSSGSTTVESTGRKKWTDYEKSKLVMEIDDHLYAANMSHNLTYGDIFSYQMTRYMSGCSVWNKFDKSNDSVAFKRHIKAFHKFLKTPGEKNATEMLDWWLVATSESDLKKRGLFVEWLKYPCLGENTDFFLAWKELREASVAPDQYLVKFLMLADRFFKTSHSTFNMGGRERRQLVDIDYPEAMEAVGGADGRKVIQDKIEEKAKREEQARQMLGGFLRQTGDRSDLF